MARSCERCSEPSVSMKGCEFFDQLSESYCQILNDCALWSLLELHVPTKLLYSLSITICTLLIMANLRKLFISSMFQHFLILHYVLEYVLKIKLFSL